MSTTNQPPPVTVISIKVPPEPLYSEGAVSVVRCDSSAQVAPCAYRCGRCNRAWTEANQAIRCCTERVAQLSDGPQGVMPPGASDQSMSHQWGVLAPEPEVPASPAIVELMGRTRIGAMIKPIRYMGLRLIHAAVLCETPYETYLGPSAIFRFTPCTEAQARRVSEYDDGLPPEMEPLLDCPVSDDEDDDFHDGDWDEDSPIVDEGED